MDFVFKNIFWWFLVALSSGARVSNSTRRVALLFKIDAFSDPTSRNFSAYPAETGTKSLLIVLS